MYASPGVATRRWQGFPVALGAPYKPCQRRKQGVRSVTDVLIHGVTHVMIQNSFSSDIKNMPKGALAPEDKSHTLLSRPWRCSLLAASSSSLTEPTCPPACVTPA